MSKHTPEERKAMKNFLADVEVRLNSRQTALHNRPDWRPEYGTLEAWNAAVDAEREHLSNEWQMLRDIRKEYGI